MRSVAILGFGYIGSVIGAVLSSAGLMVVGIDTNEELIAGISSGHCPIPEPDLESLIGEGLARGHLSVTTDPSAVAGVDAVVITVGTPLSEEFDADLSHIRDACSAIAPHLSDGQVVMIKSTVPLGVTRLMAEELLRESANVLVAFSPERLAEGDAIREFRTLPIVVGGIDPESTAAASEFWRESLGVEIIPVSSPETAELVKLADNEWIDLNIALAHEIAMLADALPYPIDVLEVIRGANSLKKGQHYVNILTPSNGVGGYCLTKDPWFVDALGKRYGAELRLPAAGRAVNDSMPRYVFERIDRFLRERMDDPATSKVAVLGYSFKTDSGDTRYTPVQPFIDALRGAGYAHVEVCDPTVPSEEAARNGVALNPDWREALRGAAAVAIMAGHREFREIGVEDFVDLLVPGALVFDGRIYYDRPMIDALTNAGFSYRGVGRS
jgi:nucleotide sugar dehydrogenase